MIRRARKSEAEVKRTFRSLPAVLLLASLGGCLHVDSCTRLREFERLRWPSRLYYSLPQVDVRALDPAVRVAIKAFLRRMRVDESFEIVMAKADGSYLLIDIRGACLDCDRWLVYSTPKRCIVGAFFPAPQG